MVRSWVRCGTLVLVEGNFGANGLSLPTSPRPWSSACTIAGRSSDSAIAWRTRLSVNGDWSLRIDSSRWLEDLSLMILYGCC